MAGIPTLQGNGGRVDLEESEMARCHGGVEEGEAVVGIYYIERRMNKYKKQISTKQTKKTNKESPEIM